MTKALNYRNGLWLGTKQYSRFVPAPQRGASASSMGFSETLTGKNGGGYVSQSFGRHATFQYDWPRSTDRSVANYIQGLRDGTYGRGVIHFTDPTCYETNVMAPHWANPGLTLGFEAPPLVFREQPEPFVFGTSDRPNTPLNGAIYTNLPVFMSREDAFYVPIPPGMAFLFGSRYEASDGGRVFVSPVDRNQGNNLGARVEMPRGIDPVNPFRNLVTHEFPGSLWGGVYVWVGRTNASNYLTSTVSILDMMGKLVPESSLGTDWATKYMDDPWYGGEGHTGVRIDGQPTIVRDGLSNTSVSATFTEVGAWELGSRL